jgi:hypothetical protein
VLSTDGSTEKKLAPESVTTSKWTFWLDSLAGPGEMAVTQLDTTWLVVSKVREMDSAPAKVGAWLGTKGGGGKMALLSSFPDTAKMRTWMRSFAESSGTRESREW